jgi:hypothetical protein
VKVEHLLLHQTLQAQTLVTQLYSVMAAATLVLVLLLVQVLQHVTRTWLRCMQQMQQLSQVLLYTSQAMAKLQHVMLLTVVQ